MSKKEEYRKNNEAFLAEMAKLSEVKSLGGGVLYKVLNTGEGKTTANARSIVTCHYTGKFIDGKEFDTSRNEACPTAFRANELIEGFTMALCNMHVGDRWEVYIPWQKGYGNKSYAGIPGCSTLIFDIEVFGIA